MRNPKIATEIDYYNGKIDGIHSYEYDKQGRPIKWIDALNDSYSTMEGLRGIQKGIASKGGTKKTDKVWERIGRLKEKYSSTHQYYDITVTDNGKGTATSLSFEKKAGVCVQNKAGIYFLRTSLNGKEE